MTTRWTAVGGLLLLALTTHALLGPAPPRHADKGGPGSVQAPDQSDPAPPRPDDLAPPRDDELIPPRPEDLAPLSPKDLDQKCHNLAPPRPEGLAPPQSVNREGETQENTHTTMDPLEEYCKEACLLGCGGELCDCPDNVIG